MSDDGTIVLRAMLAALEGGCEVIEEPWGTFVVSPEFHLIHMANFLWIHSLPSGGVTEALERAEAVFAPYAIPHRKVFVEDPDLSARIRSELEARTFKVATNHVMIARRAPSLTTNPEVTLRPARDQATRDDHDTIAGLVIEDEGYDHEVSHQLLSLHWRRVAALARQVYVAYLDGEPAGNVGLDDIGGVGLVYEVETAPEMRRRGVAATMMLHIRKRAEENGLSPLGLDTDAAATTWRMYERLGFDRVGTIDGYLRE